MVGQHWSELATRAAELEQLTFLQGVLSWDQQTYMPSGGGESRGEHMAFLSGQVHGRLCDPALGDCLQALQQAGGELTARQRAGVRNLLRRHERERAVPEALVGRIARLQSRGFHAWMEARESGQFAHLEPVLTEIVAAVRERAQAMGDGREPYAAMVEEYDPGVTPEYLATVFERLRAGIAPLLDGIRGAASIPKLDRELPEAGQLQLARTVASALGFDLERGRIDLSAHPFTATIGGHDVRITTRLRADDLLDMLGSTIHETGHALYEQGLPRGEPGISEAASMGLHESQSRFWENLVGRSRPFLTWLVGPLREAFGLDLTADELYRYANRVEPGFIRIEADEVTYNLHVGLRFDLERQLFAAREPLEVRDLPEAWNAAVARDLGLEVRDPRVGVLQDVHWPSAAFGYFPSYTLGNLYAASFLRAMERDVPELWAEAERGSFTPALAWLREHVHARGAEVDAPELVQVVCGEQSDSVQDLLDHLWARHGALYGLTSSPS